MALEPCRSHPDHKMGHRSYCPHQPRDFEHPSFVQKSSIRDRGWNVAWPAFQLACNRVQGSYALPCHFTVSSTNDSKMNRESTKTLLVGSAGARVRFASHVPSSPQSSADVDG